MAPNKLEAGVTGETVPKATMSHDQRQDVRVDCLDQGHSCLATLPASCQIKRGFLRYSSDNQALYTEAYYPTVQVALPADFTHCKLLDCSQVRMINNGEKRRKAATQTLH